MRFKAENNLVIEFHVEPSRYIVWCKKSESSCNFRGYHRDDGPAITYLNGDRFWYQNGKLYRKVGPSIEYANGFKYWYQNEEYHREDGPAIEGLNGENHFYIKGRHYTEKDYWERINNDV